MSDATLNNVKDADVVTVKANRNQVRYDVHATRNQPGMASVVIVPGTPEFNRFLISKAGSAVRGFNDVSIAISTLFKTVDPIKHPELVTSIQEWFDTLHSENDQLRDKLVSFLQTITTDNNDPFLSSIHYTPYKYDPIQLNFNHANTMRFYKYIHDMNSHLTTMAKYNALGLLAISDYNVMAHNIIKSISMYVERVKRTLNVSRRNEGPYNPEVFIEKVKQYKSVQAYIGAELLSKSVKE
jgi:hypothetical protein